MSFSSGSANISNIVENWIFDIEYAGSSSGTVRLALKDYHDGTNFYYGVILNNPSIRDSIDLKKSTAKTSNLTITIADFEYKGNKISEFIFGSVNYFINRNTTVKSVINDDSAVTIGNFRLIDFSTDGNNVNLIFSSHRPWDFISFPQNKHEDYNVYEPVVYGSYGIGRDPSDGNSTANADNVAYGTRTVFPVPVLQTTTDFVWTLMPRAYSASDNAYIHNYVENTNGQFIPLRQSIAVWNADSNRVDSDTQTNLDSSGFNILSSRLQSNVSSTWYNASFKGMITTSIADDSNKGAVTYFSNEDNMFKWSPSGTLDETVVATSPVFDTSAESSYYIMVTTPPKQFAYERIDGFHPRATAIDDDSSAVSNPQVIHWDALSHRFLDPEDDLINQDGNEVRFYNDVVQGGTGGTYLSTTTGRYDMQFNLSPSNIPSSSGYTSAMTPDNVLFKLTAESNSAFNPENFILKMHSLRLYYTQLIHKFDPSNDLAIDDHNTLAKIKQFYCGADGLKHGITALSGNDITEIHEAHLDLLNRFTGLNTSNMNTVDGWSDLDSAKDWKIRYWKLKPTQLKRELEKLQYEGGFIFKYKKGNTSEPQYIFIKDSYSSTDYTLTKNDISSVNIQSDSYSDLLTKMSIEYQKSPSGNGYYFKKDASNNTSRSNYNIDTKENIASVNLDAYVLPEIPSTPSSNPNDDFYTYYDNIFGDIKVNISGEIVNPKFYDIDIGDTVDFSDMYPEKAFGKSFTNVVFMITSLSRTMGSLKFTAREIGAIT